MSFIEILPLAILGATATGMLYMMFRAILSSFRPSQFGLLPEAESKKHRSKFQPRIG